MFVKEAAGEETRGGGGDRVKAESEKDNALSQSQELSLDEAVSYPLSPALLSVSSSSLSSSLKHLVLYSYIQK